MSEALTFGVGIPAPEPGYYVGIPAEVYHAWDACSNSRLRAIRRSPAHLQSAVVDGSAETEAKKFGSAVHMAVLEPELFGVRYAPKEQCWAYTAGGEGPRCKSQGSYLTDTGRILCGTHYGDEPLDETVTLIAPDEYSACARMKAAVKGKRRAAHLIGASGDFELSLVWDETVTVAVAAGEPVAVTVRCKARVDHYSPDLDGGTAMDLKSTMDAGEEAFTRDIYNYGYHEQGGFYGRGLQALSLPFRHWVILAMEKKPPYEVGVFRMTEGTLDAGEQLVQQRLQLYARCQHLGEWPGYPDRVRDVAVPDWAWKKMDDELTEWEEAWRL